MTAMLQCRNPSGLNRSAHRRVCTVDVAEAGDVDAVHLLRLLREGEAELLAPLVEFTEIVDREAELDTSRRMIVGSGMEGKRRFARRELAPEGRLELELEPQSVAVEGDRPVHVGDIF